jgi:excisionase family DNA binding protein
MNILKPENEQPPYALRTRDAAKALGISQSTLVRLTKAGELPVKKTGRCNLYPTEALQRWLNTEAEGGSHAAH